MSPRARPRPHRDPPAGDGMPSERQVVFWLAALAAIVLLLWLLSQILLPFGNGFHVSGSLQTTVEHDSGALLEVSIDANRRLSRAIPKITLLAGLGKNQTLMI